MAILMVLDDIPRREITITRHGRPVAVIVRPDERVAALFPPGPLDGSGPKVGPQAAVLGAKYRLRGPDATHLAAAIAMGATRFITNNSKDFGPFIKEIEVTYPAALPGPETLD
jgi:antitoxin (DNA-binding transcriptional repressor) of toxin-antitoxin stability system